MKYHNGNILCLTYEELVPSLLSESGYKQSKLRGKITVHGRGGNGREVLIEFETLPKNYKAKVKEVYGDPYEFIAQEPIRKLVTEDHKALAFYMGYTLPSGMKLPEEYVQKYTKAASWINTIILYTTDKKALKQALNVSVGAFWGIVAKMIISESIHLPTSEKRLKEKIKQYKAESYPCFVEAWRFGNDNSKKVKDDVAEALLLEMIAHGHKHDDTIIAAKYNDWAKANNRECITAGAVTYRRHKNEHTVTLGRDGKAKNYSKYSKRILRERPSAPLLLINSDDNNLDLYFREERAVKGRKVINNYYRPALYVVMDAYNDYILGWAIGDNVTIDLVKDAYRNALNHVIELTGGAYCWHQIQTDHWAIDPKKEGPLATFFKDMATFTPATAKVAQAKYIERSFGTVWHQQLKMFPNYAGHNITAKEKLNPDAVQRSIKDFPLKEHAPQVVAGFIEMMRQTINPKTGLSRQNEWVDAFFNSEKSRVKLLSPEAKLLKFGVAYPNQRVITTEPLKLSINKQEFVYDLPDALYPEHVGKKVQVLYDPYDLSQILATDGKGLRFTADKYRYAKSALADFEEGDRTLLNSRIEVKENIQAFIGDEVQRRAEILQRANVDAESLLQAGVLTKGIRHAAERTATRSLPPVEDTDSNLNIYHYM